MKTVYATLISMLVLATAATTDGLSASRSSGRIAFVADTGGTAQVFTVDPDGTHVSRVTNEPQGAGDLGLAWSADGSQLYFVVSTDRDLVFRSDVHGGHETRVSIGCTGLCLGDDHPAISRSGAKIAFQRAIGPVVDDNAAVVAIDTMNIDGTGLKQLTQKKRPTSTEDDTPSWSPDGRRIAFRRYDKAKQIGAVYVMNADGSHVRRVTPTALDAGQPKWSRDGTKILFNDGDGDSSLSANLYTIRVDGTGLKKLTHYSGAAKAFADDWSPDGTRIVFHLVTGSVNGLYVMNADGSHISPLTHLGTSANARNAVWTRGG